MAPPPALAAYLAEFDALVHRLPRDARHEARARIWTHCAAQAGPGASDDDVRAALDGLGSPAELVGTELVRTGARPDPLRPRDLAAMHLLGASFLTLGLGALAGLVLLWRSRAWPVRHRVVATALVGLGAALGAVVPLVVSPAPPLPVAVAVGAIGAGPLLAAAALFVASRQIRSAVSG